MMIFIYIWLWSAIVASLVMNTDESGYIKCFAKALLWSVFLISENK